MQKIDCLVKKAIFGAFCLSSNRFASCVTARMELDAGLTFAFDWTVGIDKLFIWWILEVNWLIVQSCWVMSEVDRTCKTYEFCLAIFKGIGYTAKVYRELQVLYREIRLQGFLIYRDLSCVILLVTVRVILYKIYRDCM